MFDPTAIPQDAPRGLRSWLAAMLRDLSTALTRPEVEGVRFKVLHESPERIANGDVVVADGSDWNPGSGAGVYARISGAWVKL